MGSPKLYNSRHLRLPEHFQHSLPFSTAGDASFFRNGSGEGIPNNTEGISDALKPDLFVSRYLVGRAQTNLARLRLGFFRPQTGT